MILNIDDFECGQMAYYHFFYLTYGTRRYSDSETLVWTFVLIRIFITKKKGKRVIVSHKREK